MLRTVLYNAGFHDTWDKFIKEAKNGTFLFLRDYMDYHSDRFEDHSLLFFDDDRLIALFPANRADGILASHGGLTFGGVITNHRLRAGTMLEIFARLISHAESSGFSEIIYKAIPHIYHDIPAEEDLYALFRCNARLIRRDPSSTISMARPADFSKGRKWSMNQARKRELIVRQTDDFTTFMAVEEGVLRRGHGRKPVHSPEEIRMLAERFPDHIKLFGAFEKDRLLAGVVIYESKHVAHAQYISATDEGKECGAIDVILEYLIREYYCDKRYFDFGISSEKDGRYLNAGLIENKEGFGARTVVYDFYSISLPCAVN